LFQELNPTAMASSSSFAAIDLSPEPDLHPIYPTAAFLAPLLSPQSGLSPAQKHELVSHSLSRACTFGELALLSYLLTDHAAQSFVDLTARDEDGLGIVSLTIQGFGAESDRDVEREECVRLLIADGADVSAIDNGPSRCPVAPAHLPDPALRQRDGRRCTTPRCSRPRRSSRTS
jgi:hypothetical protein